MKLDGAALRSFITIGNRVNQTTETSIGIFRIPHYQRPYKWGDVDIDDNDKDENRVRKLIDDFFEHLNSKSSDNLSDSKVYFGGAAVAVVSDDKTYDLIDGQQRYTTLFLFNFLRFIISRTAIRARIESGNSFSNELTSLIQSMNYLFIESNQLLHIYKKLNELNVEIDESESKSEDFKESKLKEYRLLMSLPEIKEGNNNYEIQFAEKLQFFLQDKELRLKYGRESLNKLLIKTLSCVSFKLNEHDGPLLTILNIKNNKYCKIKNPNDVTEIESRPYLNALDIIFNSILERTNIEQTPTRRARTIVNNIEEVLNNFFICMVHTSDEDSAYTLFEVLNDRALALEDLDLIKNTFYRKFCQNNQSDENVITNTLRDLEKKWGDIFVKNEAEYMQKYILFFGTQYITGKDDLGFKEKKGHLKDAIIKEFDKRTQCNIKYSKELIESDFNAFSLVKKLLEHSEIRSKNSSTFEEFINPQCSEIKKLFHLCHDLKIQGIWACFFNPLLNYINSSSFNLSDENLKGLFKKNTSPTELETLAKNITDTILLSSNFSIALKKFKELKILYKKPTDLTFGFSMSIQNFKIDETTFDELYKDFINWTSSWTYKNSKHDLKMRILFINSYGYKLENGILKKGAINLIPNIKDPQFDHLEPQSIDTNCIDRYLPDDEFRSTAINRLGNILLISGKLNNELKNNPLQVRLENIKDKGISGIWILELTENFFINNSIETNSFRVPTRKFFEERQLMLQKILFKAMVIKNKNLESIELN